MNKTTKTILLIIIVVIVIVGIWYGVSKKSVEKKSIKVGVLTSLSGDYVSLFRGIERGANLATEDLKKELDNKVDMKLFIEDTKSCDAQEAVTAVNKLVNIEKVDVIIGGTCSNTTLAVAPIVNQTKTIMISPASSAPSISRAGEYVFRTYISDILRAKEAARLAYDLGKRKMALITDISNDGMVELTKGAKEEFTKLGGKIVAEEEMTKADTDFRTQLTKIKASNPDVLYIGITGPNQIALVVKQARELGLSVQLIVPAETVEDPNVIKVAGATIEGLIYIMPGNPPETGKYKELKKRYKEKYNEDMPSYTTEAYDAVILGVKAVLASNGTKEDIKNKLFEVSKNYSGVSGNVTFDENGDVTKSVMFKTIKNGQFVPYEK